MLKKLYFPINQINQKQTAREVSSSKSLKQWEQVRLQTKAKITIMWPEYRCVTMHNTKTQLSTIHHLTPEQSFLSFQIRVHPTHWTETAMKTQEKYWQLFLNSQRMFTHGKDTLKLDKSYQLVGCTAGKWFPPKGRDSVWIPQSPS